MILSVLLWLWVVLSGAVISIVSLVLFIPFNPWFDKRRRVAGYLGHLWGAGIIFWLRGLKYQLIGTENLTYGGPYLIVANHSSVADIIVLLTWLPSTTKMIAKIALFRTPPIGLQLWLSGYIPVHGTEGESQQILDRAVSWLKKGCHILVFPEGTRSENGEVLRFRKGPFVIAQTAGVPILPVSISGTRSVIPKGSSRFSLRGHLVRLHFMTPEPSVGSPKEMAARARARIQEDLNTLRSNLS